jgi:hypothetical protein
MTHELAWIFVVFLDPCKALADEEQCPQLCQRRGHRDERQEL